MESWNALKEQNNKTDPQEGHWTGLALPPSTETVAWLFKQGLEEMHKIKYHSKSYETTCLQNWWPQGKDLKLDPWRLLKQMTHLLREKEKSKQCKRNAPQPNRSLTRVIPTATDLVSSLYRKPSDSQTAALVSGSLWIVRNQFKNTKHIKPVKLKEFFILITCLQVARASATRSQGALGLPGWKSKTQPTSAPPAPRVA